MRAAERDAASDKQKVEFARLHSVEQRIVVKVALATVTRVWASRLTFKQGYDRFRTACGCLYLAACSPWPGVSWP
jgi:hypothetical protein